MLPTAKTHTPLDLRRRLLSVAHRLPVGIWALSALQLPPWQTVYYHFKQFCRTGLWTRLYRALRDAERRRAIRKDRRGVRLHPRNRRMSKDYERKVQTSEAFIEVVKIRLLVTRLRRRTA